MIKAIFCITAMTWEIFIIGAGVAKLWIDVMKYLEEMDE